ncbi:MAG TPA: polysaccharide deacetylase family protein [Polyangiaceae bacterium]|nr:polysaccharide deacetylase family protein [Polyangiaceae bacterium]
MPPARLALYAASLAVVVASARAALVGAPPLGWAVAMLSAYVALVLGGVLVLRWRVFVDAVVRGPPGARGVALTFDDGPHPRWTPRVLDLLRERGVTATFFVVGRKVESHPDVVRAIVERGHAVGLHSYSHDRLFALRSERWVRTDLQRGIAAVERVTGRRPVLFRPPIGHTNPIVARVADALDLTVVGWTVAGRDGVASARPEDVAARVRRDLRDGAIVLLHDAPEKGDREPAAVRALGAILDGAAAERLAVVPLAAWLGAAQELEAGSTT